MDQRATSLNLDRENLAESDPVIIPYKVINLIGINYLIWFNYMITVRQDSAREV